MSEPVTWETTAWMVTGFAGIPIINTIAHTRKESIDKAVRGAYPPATSWDALRNDGYRAVKVVVTWTLPVKP